MTRRWTSEPLAVPRDAAAPFTHANLEFEDVEHDGPSFVVQLVFNNPTVAETAAEDAEGGAGHFTVFGHGECWGDEGHCDAAAPALAAVDRRPFHPLTPINVTVDVTRALQALHHADEIVVTALVHPVDPVAETPALRFKRLSLVTFE